MKVTLLHKAEGYSQQLCLKIPGRHIGNKVNQMEQIFAGIEDGNFNTPSCYMSEEEGRCLAQYTGQQITLDRISNSIQRA